MKEGTVKFYDQTKGFGFITAADGSEDVFMHQTGLIDDVAENDRVTFELGQGKKGVNAINVRVANN